AFDRAGYEAFRPLADFIGGENDGGTTIEMTAPVEQRGGQKIPMTAPVTQQADGDRRYTVGFVMPPDMTLATTPRPTNPKIALRELPERLLAVREYRGGWSESRYRREERVLRDALIEAGYEPLGSPIFARYNSPFMIWFLRRNAVMIEIAPAIASDRGRNKYPIRR
ncbi:MAG: heme-binding protein, partial [Myxococcales bacterium]|nr:heme-binding protein [Myxococcales bacterium]